ncbi:MAG: cytochrome c3 family protein [Bacillota bacterium]|nr:cytochrome c3 family protein [Bacillota bacterium]
MKRPLLIALVALGWVALLGAGALSASIVNSKHDLSAGSLNGGITSSESQVCIFCHTPHSATANTPPLWNRSKGAGPYQMYSNPGSIQGQIAAAPDGGSELCLSCHDGTIALNSVVNESATGTPTLNDARTPSHLTADGKLTGYALIGTDLRNDHPVSITYAYPDDPGLNNPATLSLPLYNNKVQCSSCHSVHDPANTPFLRLNNTGSALCLACHNK